MKQGCLTGLFAASALAAFGTSTVGAQERRFL